MFEGIQLSNLFWNLGQWAGLIGFAGLSFLIFSGDTARFWDRYFGLDKIIKFQRKFSLAVAVFVLLHPLFFILSGQRAKNYLIPDFAVLPLSLGIMSLYIFVAVMIASTVYKRISYAVWQYIHLLTYALFFFVLYHAVNWGSDRDRAALKLLYGILLIAVFVGAIYRTQYKIKKRFAGKFYVKAIKWETSDTFTLALRTEKPCNFQAGQFYFLRLNKNHLHARHPFTVSSSPDEPDLCFTIKKTGRFTKTAAELKIGEEVIVDGPFGKFGRKDQAKNSVFIAGGVGITPFMSLLKDQLNKKRTQNITLLYGSKTEKDLIFKSEIDGINENWFKKVYILSQEKSLTMSCENGYITKNLIQKYVKDISDSLFYICGPEKMKVNVKCALADLGVKKKNIFIEDFFW